MYSTRTLRSGVCHDTPLGFTSRLLTKSTAILRFVELVPDARPRSPCPRNRGSRRPRRAACAAGSGCRPPEDLSNLPLLLTGGRANVTRRPAVHRAVDLLLDVQRGPRRARRRQNWRIESLVPADAYCPRSLPGIFLVTVDSRVAGLAWWRIWPSFLRKALEAGPRISGVPFTREMLTRHEVGGGPRLRDDRITRRSGILLCSFARAGTWGRKPRTGCVPKKHSGPETEAAVAPNRRGRGQRRPSTKRNDNRRCS